MAEPAHLSSFELERHAHGAGERPAEAQAVTAHLATCAACRAALDETLGARDFAAREIVPAERDRTVRQINRRRRLIWAGVSLVPATCAVAAAIVFPILQARLHAGAGALPGDDDSLGIKGDTALTVYVQRDDRAVELRSGAQLTAGDRLRLEIDPAGLPYLLVASIDAAGQVSVYVPYHGSERQPVNPHSRFVSPGSIELDRVPGPERIFALLSRTPLHADTVAQALRALGAQGPAAIRNQSVLDLPPAAALEAQRSFLWENLSR